MTAGDGWDPEWRDVEILRLLAQGHTIEAISHQTALSPRTVRRRLRALADEAGVRSTIEVVVRAVRLGLI